MKKHSLLIALIIIIILIVFIVLNITGFFVDNFPFLSENLTNSRTIEPQKLFLKSWKIVKKRYYDSTLNHQDWNKWKKRYLDSIFTTEDAYLAINTMLASLDDPYSRFLSAEEYSEQITNIDSKIIGVGINITSLSGKILVISTVDETPAKKSGILAGDVLLKVNDIDVQGKSISEIAQLVRGREGVPVTLELSRGGEKLTKVLIRKEIKIKNIEHRLLVDNVGYIRITSFLGTSVPEEFLQAIANLKNVKGYIIDLRGNTGGLLPNAVFLSDLFLNSGNIVSVVDRNGVKSDINAKVKNLIIDKPVILLIDESTASASEIFTAALKEYDKAILVGQKTYGKGLVQKIYPMPNKTGMNLTIAKYLTPFGNDINKKGIEPDFLIPITIKDYSTNKDPQLDRALFIMSKFN